MRYYTYDPQRAAQHFSPTNATGLLSFSKASVPVQVSLSMLYDFTTQSNFPVDKVCTHP